MEDGGRGRFEEVANRAHPHRSVCLAELGCVCGAPGLHTRNQSCSSNFGGGRSQQELLCGGDLRVQRGQHALGSPHQTIGHR